MGNIIQPPIPLEKLLFLRACTLNNLPEVKSLLAGGADVNWRWRENRGWSGLHLAAVHNYQELLELLLAQPALDVNLSDEASNMAPRQSGDLSLVQINRDTLPIFLKQQNAQNA